MTGGRGGNEGGGRRGGEGKDGGKSGRISRKDDGGDTGTSDCANEFEQRKCSDCLRLKDCSPCQKFKENLKTKDGNFKGVLKLFKELPLEVQEYILTRNNVMTLLRVPAKKQKTFRNFFENVDRNCAILDQFDKLLKTLWF